MFAYSLIKKRNARWRWLLQNLHNLHTVFAWQANSTMVLSSPDAVRNWDASVIEGNRFIGSSDGSLNRFAAGVEMTAVAILLLETWDPTLGVFFFWTVRPTSSGLDGGLHLFHGYNLETKYISLTNVHLSQDLQAQMHHMFHQKQAAIDWGIAGWWPF